MVHKKNTTKLFRTFSS